MLKNFLSIVLIAAALFSARDINANEKEELNNLIDTIVATGNINKYCREIKKLGMNYLKNPELKKILQEMGFSEDQIHSIKKVSKKVVKASVDAIKVECKARAPKSPSILATIEQGSLRFLRLVGSPYLQEMQKKWEALVEDMKQNSISKQNA